MTNALPIGRYPTPLVNVRCSRCGRRGRYRLAFLVERFGADRPAPDVAAALERDSGCEHVDVYGGCFVVFEELARC